MPSKVCILNDVLIRLSVAGRESVFKSDATGLEMDTPIKTMDSDKDYRVYVCRNCGYEAEGADTFDLMRGHLGKMHELIDPFVIKRVTP